MSNKRTKAQLNLHIGGLDDMGQRFTAAWKALQKNQPVARDHVTFLTLGDFMAAMSPKRLELLRHLRKVGPLSVRKLSSELDRDYKSVHLDVARLEKAGLIERSAKSFVCVTWNRALAQLDLAA
jgi:predicted transcriptional regulator